MRTGVFARPRRCDQLALTVRLRHGSSPPCSSRAKFRSLEGPRDGASSDKRQQGGRDFRMSVSRLPVIARRSAVEPYPARLQAAQPEVLPRFLRLVENVAEVETFAISVAQGL